MLEFLFINCTGITGHNISHISWQNLHWTPAPTDECNRYTILQSRDSCPFPCALLPSTVSDFGQQVSAIRVLVLQNVCSDLDKEGIQLCFIPLVKSLRRKQCLEEPYSKSGYLRWKKLKDRRRKCRIIVGLGLTFAMSSWSIANTSFIRW